MFKMHLWTIAAGLLIQSCNIGYALEECKFHGETICCDYCCSHSCCTESYDSSECDDGPYVGTGMIIFIVVVCVILVLAFCLSVLILTRQFDDMFSTPEATAIYEEVIEENSTGDSAATRNIRDRNGPPPSYGSVMKDQRRQK